MDYGPDIQTLDEAETVSFFDLSRENSIPTNHQQHYMQLGFNLVALPADTEILEALERISQDKAPLNLLQHIINSAVQRGLAKQDSVLAYGLGIEKISERKGGLIR